MLAGEVGLPYNTPPERKRPQAGCGTSLRNIIRIEE